MANNFTSDRERVWFYLKMENFERTESKLLGNIARRRRRALYANRPRRHGKIIILNNAARKDYDRERFLRSFERPSRSYMGAEEASAQKLNVRLNLITRVM